MLVALDPGLAAFGAVAMDARGEILGADVCTTEPDTVPSSRPRKPGAKRNRSKVRGGSAHDTDRRTVIVSHWLGAFLERWQPRAVVAEAAGGSKGARAGAMLAAASAIAAIAVDGIGWGDTPLVRVHVQQWRRTFVPDKRKIPDAELYACLADVTRGKILVFLGEQGRRPSLGVHAYDAALIGRWAIKFSAVARRALGIDEAGL